jgi:hypothetical protein
MTFNPHHHTLSTPKDTVAFYRDERILEYDLSLLLRCRSTRPEFAEIPYAAKGGRAFQLPVRVHSPRISVGKSGHRQLSCDERQIRTTTR